MTPFDVSGLIPFLSAISSIAVIAGAIFIVFQLRQNARLIETAIFENKSNIAFTLTEKLTDESFPRRRKMMHDTVAKYSKINWEGFDDTPEDFEVRNFGYIYELWGQLIKDEILDLKTMMRILKYIVVLDWDAFKPFARHLVERYKQNMNPYENFEWLAEETRKYLRA